MTDFCTWTRCWRVKSKILMALLPVLCKQWEVCLTVPSNRSWFKYHWQTGHTAYTLFSRDEITSCMKLFPIGMTPDHSIFPKHNLGNGDSCGECPQIGPCLQRIVPNRKSRSRRTRFQKTWIIEHRLSSYFTTTNSQGCKKCHDRKDF